MTYREAIQQLQRKIDECAGAAEVLRDYADLSEKKYWNYLRGELLTGYSQLSKLDDSLPDNRASMPVRVTL